MSIQQEWAQEVEEDSGGVAAQKVENGVVGEGGGIWNGRSGAKGEVAMVVGDMEMEKEASEVVEKAKAATVGVTVMEATNNVRGVWNSFRVSLWSFHF